MKKLIVLGNIPKNLPYMVNNFEDEYSKYLRKAPKEWRTPEGFSLDFDSTLSDLKKAYFIYVDDIDLELRQRLKVIEEL